MKMEKLNGELRKFISLGRKILTLQIDPLPCEHPLKSSVPFRSGPFCSVPFSCERGLNLPGESIKKDQRLKSSCSLNIKVMILRHELMS